MVTAAAPSARRISLAAATTFCEVEGSSTPYTFMVYTVDSAASGRHRGLPGDSPRRSTGRPAGMSQQVAVDPPRSARTWLVAGVIAACIVVGIVLLALLLNPAHRMHHTADAPLAGRSAATFELLTGA